MFSRIDITFFMGSYGQRIFEDILGISLTHGVFPLPARNIRSPKHLKICKVWKHLGLS